ncbi:MAG: hypothetical protein DCC55_20360 [Chloroflexi bacterium]|nr:MAG: hypothetical protein DCC55_20360 [Chloroflexota bacterium]
MTDRTIHDWQRIGAWAGGTVTAVALSPNFATNRIALAATAAGLFRSIDGGITWQPSNTGLADRSIVAVAFAPQNRPGTHSVYAASEGGRLYTSADGGEEWDECAAWAGLGQATVLALSPNFAADQTLFVGTAEGIFRSQDGGQSWESSIFGLHDLDVLCIACAPDYATSEVLWAGTANGGFYRSRNGARSWRDSGLGLPDDAVTALVVSPTYAIDQILYAGTEGSGLYRSTDGGATWAPLFTELAAEGVLCLAATGTRLLLGTSAGLYHSGDGGHSWLAATGVDGVATSLAVSKDEVVLAGAEEGVYRSEDSGQRWQRVTQGLVAHAPPIVQRSPGGTLFALDRFGAVGMSVDGGAHWQSVTAVHELAPVTALATSEEEGQTVLYLAMLDGRLSAVSVGARIDEWGWIHTPAPVDHHFHQITVLPGAHPHRLLLVAANGQLYRWDGRIAPEPMAATPPWQGEALLQLAPAPDFAADPRLVAVSAQQNSQGNYRVQVWESFDAGVQWGYLAGLETAVPAVALCWPVDPVEQSLFLATQNRVIRFFRPGGNAGLASTQHFLADGVNITTIAASPAYAADRRLWVATNRGVYHSSDSGANWTAVGTALTDLPVVVIFSPDGSARLLAVELGGTFWSMAAGQPAYS